MIRNASQLPLPFTHRPPYARDTFLWAASNSAARAWLARTGEWPQRRLALWGEAGSGKTHLLHIWAETAAAALIDGAALTDTALPAARAIAIDDADRCAAAPALLHLLNRCAEQEVAVLLAGRAPPSRWPVGLPDLASRLRAITAVAIAPAEDVLRRALFDRLLAEHQLFLAPDLQDWLLLRLPRTTAAMREAAWRLNRAGLAAGTRLGRKLVGEVAAAMTGAAHEKPIKKVLSADYAQGADD